MSKPISHLIPSIDRRLSTWLSIDEKRSKTEKPKVRPTVTVSREYGCEGYPLSELLKEIFEERTGEVWNIYDKALLEEVSADEHLSMLLLKDLGNAAHALDSFAFLIPDYVAHKEAFLRIPKHIIKIAEAGNAVIVGRGGAIIAHKLANCFHFRLEASFEFRVQSVMRRQELGRAEAEKQVKSNQKIRESFIRDCLHADISDISHYDAVFNNGRHTVREIAWSIASYVAQAWGDREYFKFNHR